MNSEILSLLEQTIRSSGKSRREIEQRLGMGQGYLTSLFKGRIQLRVAHIEEIAGILDIEPSSLFVQAFPPKDPDHLLRLLGIPPKMKAPADLRSEHSPEELERLIRKVVQDELARLAGRKEEEDEPEPPGSGPSPPSEPEP